MDRKVKWSHEAFDEVNAAQPDDLMGSATSEKHLDFPDVQLVAMRRWR